MLQKLITFVAVTFVLLTVLAVSAQAQVVPPAPPVPKGAVAVPDPAVDAAVVAAKKRLVDVNAQLELCRGEMAIILDLVAADEVAAKALKKAKDREAIIVDHPGGETGYILSKFTQAKNSYEIAAQNLEKLKADSPSVSATDPAYQQAVRELDSKLKKFNGARLQAQELRLQIRKEFAVRFETPENATAESILQELTGIALEAKTATADALAKAIGEAENLKRDIPSDIVLPITVEHLQKALKVLEAEQNRLLEVISAGKTAEAVNRIGGKLVGLADDVSEIKTGIETANQTLLKIDGKIVTMNQSVEALTKLAGNKTGGAIAQVATSGLSSEDSKKIGQILTALTAHVQTSANRDKAVNDINDRLEAIQPIIEELKAKAAGSKELYVQYFDGCKWHQVNTVTKEAKSS